MITNHEFFSSYLFILNGNLNVLNLPYLVYTAIIKMDLFSILNNIPLKNQYLLVIFEDNLFHQVST